MKRVPDCTKYLGLVSLAVKFGLGRITNQQQEAELHVYGLERARGGEKGLARFGADCLAEKLRIVSKPGRLSRKHTTNVN